MPVDPAISLQAQAPTNQLDPFATISKFAEVQDKLNQVRLFNQTYAARQAAGQILATAPDVGTAVQRLQTNPLTSAFAPEIANTAANTAAVMTQRAGAIQGQANTAFETMLKNLPAVLEDPSQWGNLTSMSLATTPPEAKGQVAEAIESLRRSLTDGLPPDSDQARGTFLRRGMGLMLSTGVTPEVLNRLYGTTGTLQTGSQTLGTVQGQPGGLPGVSPAPGEIRTTAGGIPAGLPPSIQSIPNPAGGSTTAIVHDTGGGAVVPLGSTPTTVQAGELTGKATSAVDLTKAANTVADVLPQRIKALDTIEDTLRQFQAGGGTPTRAAAAQIVQGLRNLGLTGISDETVNKIASGSLPAVQLFDTQLKPLLTNMLTHDAAGQGRVMLPEVEAYIHLLDTAKDPRAIVNALNNIRYGYQVGYDKASKWQDYQATGGDPGAFLTNYVSHFDRSKLPPKAGDLRLSPTDPKSVLGGGGQRSLQDIFGTKPQGATR